MRRLLIIVILGCCLVFFCFCETGNRQVKNANCKINITIDSIFINQYKQASISEPLFIYYYLSIENNSDDTLRIDLPLTSLEYRYRVINQIYGIYKGDTINFFSGSKSEIMPKESKAVVLRFGDGDDIEQIFYKSKKRKIKSFDNFFSDFIKKSKLIFLFENKLYKVNQDSVSVIYRDLSDKGEHMWPLL